MKFKNLPNLGSTLQTHALFVLILLIPAFVFAQDKKSPPKPSAPAPHASAPAHTAPSSQRTNTTQHSAPGHTAPGNATGRTGTNATGRTGGPGNGNGHAAPNSAGRTGNNGNMGRGPNGNAGRGPNGNVAGRGPAGHVAPGRQVSLRGGGSASIRPNGQIRSVNRNGMQINRGMHGGRTIVSSRNGVRVVGVGRRGGYVQRAYVVRGGHSYYSRTYYYHGAYRSGVYRGYYYGGRPYYGYYPAYYYQPAYYGWAYNPWPAPAYYGWGWGGSPWYGYYGAYYQPYPVYPTAAFWITDFMVAATLQAAYEAQANAWLQVPSDGNLIASLAPILPPAAETAKLSPEVKQALSDEVKLTLAAEQAEAGKGKSNASASGGQPATSNEAPPALDPNFRTFMVSSDMSLVADGDDECPLSQGDIIQRTTETPDADGNVNVKVVASTKSDCAVGKEGPVSTDDLQEMYNQFREQLKDGMGELAKKQGTGGLPKAPDTSTVDGDVPAPPPDKNVEKTLQDQQSSADQAETEVKQESGSGSGGAQ